jgi:glyoxylase-like metal-dependent hydrolase (beta-lactamase superfamily II)
MNAAHQISPSCREKRITIDTHRRRFHIPFVTNSLPFLTYTGGIAETNGYFLRTADGGLLIDAPEGVASWLAEQGLHATRLILTHQHFDHVMDAAALQQTGTKILAFADYDPQLTLEHVARSWGMPDVKTYKVDELLPVDQPWEWDGLRLSLAHVPGHSPDSITLYHAESGTLFSGDTLFQQSIGRTDIPGHGNHRLLVDGIRQKILSLPAETMVYPGHGGGTTIDREIRSNPYLV